MEEKTETGSTLVKESNSAEGSGKRFSKEQLACSARYAARRDLVNALLDNGREYTIQETDAAIAKYLKGRVV